MTLNLCLLGRGAKAVAIEALDPARNLLEQERSIDPVPAGGVDVQRFCDRENGRLAVDRRMDDRLICARDGR